MTRIWALFAGKRQSRIHPVDPRKNLRSATPFPVDFAPRTDCLNILQPPAPLTPPTCAVTRLGRKTNFEPSTQERMLNNWLNRKSTKIRLDSVAYSAVGAEAEKTTCCLLWCCMK
jgi:hypothetical protein